MSHPDFPPPALAAIPHPIVIPPELVPEHRGAVAFLSTVSRSGDWILPRHFRAVAFMGNTEIDLTCARVGPGTSRIEVVAIMGNVTILVPPELRIECDGDPMLGSFDVKREVPNTTSPDAPLIWISGSVYAGSVDVKVIDPNAPGWIDKLRAKLSRRRR